MNNDYELKSGIWVGIFCEQIGIIIDSIHLYPVNFGTLKVSSDGKWLSV